MTYPDSVRYLYALGNEIRTAKLGLERVEALAARLGHPESAFRTVHVAGTNGKGSVCAMVAAGLQSSGLKTGLYTSPHLVEPTERIRIDGQPVAQELFLECFEQVHRTASEMVDRGELPAHPTYFETVTLMGLLAFRRMGVDTAVIEVGMGGRLDATNIVQPAVTAITPVDFDHERFLGNSLAAIAGEKAGILKSGVPAVFAPQADEAMEVLRERARALEVPVTQVPSVLEELEIRRDGCSFRFGGKTVICPLAGEHQAVNAATAASILGILGLPASGIRDTRWPGRLETVALAPDLILDGAHNPAAIAVLARHIRRFYADRPVWIIYGAMRDKSLDEIAGILTPVADRIILTAADSDRALRREAVGQFFDHPDVTIAATTREALRMAQSAPPETAVFVTGSLLLVGEVQRLLADPGQG